MLIAVLLRRNLIVSVHST